MAPRRTLVSLARANEVLRKSVSRLEANKTKSVLASNTDTLTSAILDVKTAEMYLFRAIRKLQGVRRAR